jgi:hypothetical protein
MSLSSPRGSRLLRRDGRRGGGSEKEQAFHSCGDETSSRNIFFFTLPQINAD